MLSFRQIFHIGWAQCVRPHMFLAGQQADKKLAGAGQQSKESDKRCQQGSTSLPNVASPWRCLNPRDPYALTLMNKAGFEGKLQYIAAHSKGAKTSGIFTAL